ncbi:MAG: hypothetical protein NTZ79_00425 [Proteobacteria bacterium]|nr:hypothetical protein [Pseudomonadota bacterium]
MSRFVYLAIAAGALLTFTSLSAVADATFTTCSNATVVGTYNKEEIAHSAYHVRGHTVPVTGRGTLVFDGKGNYLINVSRTGGGNVIVTTNASGTYTVDAACNFIGKRVFSEDKQLHVFTGVVTPDGNLITDHTNHANFHAIDKLVRVAPLR